MLTGVNPPGVSLLSIRATVTLFAVGVALDGFLLFALLRTPRTPAPALLPLALWLGAALLAALLGFAPAAGLVFLAIFGLCLIWHAAILRFCTTAETLRPVLWSISFSCAAACVAALAMEVFRLPPQLYAIGHGRAIGTFVLPGELAGYLIVVLPIVTYLAFAADEAALRWMARAALAAGVCAFVLTFSRTGWIGLAAAIAFYAVWSGVLRRRFAGLIVAAAVLAVLAVFNVHHNPAENYTRISIWQAALAMIRRFPLTGVGPFDFARIYPLVRVPGGDEQAFHAHDVFLTIFAETGVIGLAAMLWAWWRFAAVLRERLAAVPHNRALVLAIAAGLAGTWVQGLIDTVSVVIFGLWLPVMALALAAAGTALEKESG